MVPIGGVGFGVGSGDDGRVGVGVDVAAGTGCGVCVGGVAGVGTDVGMGETAADGMEVGTGTDVALVESDGEGAFSVAPSEQDANSKVIKRDPISGRVFI